jgi:UDP-N-acetylmuramyl tripeptide synthase
MYCYNSQEIKKGDTFLCLPGGAPYVNDAKSRGALEVKHVTRREMAELAHDYYKHPSKSLCVYGVTGTNGKTSVCHFLHCALTYLGRVSYLQGTLTHRLTTPESLDTVNVMARHRDSGGTDFVMEVFVTWHFATSRLRYRVLM